MEQEVSFPSGTVKYLFRETLDTLWEVYDRQHILIITNDHIADLYGHFLNGLKIMRVPPGEHSKNLQTIETLAKNLLQMEVTRKTVIIGVGGGVITDITGFIASIYMRGISFGFVPTTLLAMADAAIGGKNGVNIGLNKNMLGTITQPSFILYDTQFLQTLADDEWNNGFAEIIKYAAIFDAGLFEELEQNSISFYKKNEAALAALIEKCVAWKNKTVQADEHESGQRKLLNFGHTAAHAIENMYDLPHGKAVAIGMVIACLISEAVAGLAPDVTMRLKKLLQLYHLPIHQEIDAKKAMDILRMDKKRADDTIDYIVLEKIGAARVQALPLTVIEQSLSAYEGNH